MRRRWLLLVVAACGTTYGSSQGAPAQDAGSDGSPAPGLDAGVPDGTGGGACSPGPVTDGLVAYYPLDEAQGTTVRDCSGNRHDGQVLRLAPGTWVSGKRGSAIRVLSPDGCVDFGAGPEFRFTGAFTAMAWVNVASFPQNATAAIVGKSVDLDVDGWRVDSTIVTELGGVVATDGGNPLFVGRENQPTNKWLHLAVTFEPNVALEMYIDGVFAARATWSGGLIDLPSTPLRIGCRGDNGGFFDGVVDEVRIYDRKLTPTEIAILSAP